MGANIVEEAAPKNKKRKKPFGKSKEQNKKKFKGNCYNCGKAGHKTPDCRLSKKDKGKGQANKVEKNDDMDDLSFATYAPTRPEEELFMRNTATAKVEGYGKILLKMTSGKVLTLNNVLHVPTIRKNLVSAGLLVKKRV
ncbi:uncharacterized protein LOC132627247 [Lycium barbarum]|uniref:uncharacterized protein LOC132627247 n=1 Tax=Lycium barbarum TaxID=112863 RepID=UPI00293E4B5D|nr:uncharacterized protein LOC132627247 [Lycium barbarum]